MDYITINLNENEPTSIRNIEELSAVLEYKMGEPQKGDQSLFYSSVMDYKLLSAERMYWVLYGNYAYSSLKEIVESLHCKSKLVIATGITEEDYRIPADSEQELLKQWIREGKVELVFCSSPIECATYIAESMDRLAFNGWRPIIDDDLIKTNPEQLSVFYNQLGKKLNSKIIADNTRDRNFRRYLENSLVNLPLALTQSNLRIAAENYDKRPALIVSPGPSLDKQLIALRRHKDLYTIICASAAYPNLIEAGIDPDYVVSIDVSNAPVLQAGSACKLVTDLGCDPKTAWSSPHQTIFNSHAPPILDLIERIGGKLEHLPTGGSVATSAFRFAQMLGAEIVVLIGQDMAYAPDGKMRSDGYAFKEQTAHEKRRVAFSVPGYYGERVETDNALIYYKAWFEHVLSRPDSPIVFNATEGGAMIEGATNIPFVQISEEIKKYGIEKVSWSLPDFASPGESDISNIIDGIDALVTLVSVYRDISNAGVELIASYGNAPNQINFDEIDAISNQLSEFPDFAKFCIDVYATGEMKSVQRNIARSADDVKNISDLSAFYLDVFQTARQAARNSLEFLESLKPYYLSFLDDPNLVRPNKVAAEFIASSSHI